MRRVVALCLVVSCARASAQWEEIADHLQDQLVPGFYSGNELLQLGRAAFIGYVAGVHDASKLRKTFCAPERATTGQLADVAEKYLRDNPARRDQQAHLLVRDAFASAWPCSAPRPSSR